jgi:carbon-monoxide dehydrogenase medium subunit
VYPPAFDYVVPRTRDEALALLNEHGADAKIIAGGQSLIPLLRLRFAAPALLVDINWLPDLCGVAESSQSLVIGALTRHADILISRSAQAACPILVDAASQIADPQVRNLGTIGGALAHADPEGDWASVMLALRAEVSIASTTGLRIVPMRTFLESMFTTAVQPTELVTSVRIPKPRGRSGGAYLKLSRKVGDFAAVGVAVSLNIEERGRLRRQTRIAEAGIALTAVAPVNTVVEAAEEVLRDQVPTPELFAHAADIAASAVSPHADSRGSTEYKQAVVRAYVRRGLHRALESAA